MDVDFERLKVDAAYWDEILPDWVSYIAQWRDGEWLGYEIKPEDGSTEDPDDCYVDPRVDPKIHNLGEWGSPNANWRETLIKRPTTQSQEWDGTGLPPVGCECERMRHGLWVKCEVRAHGEDYGFPVAFAQTEFDCQILDERMFRPIRTPEQRFREELGDIIGKHIDVTCSVSRHIDNLNVDVGGAIDAILDKYNLTEK